jgi:hypothetical protein
MMSVSALQAETSLSVALLLYFARIKHVPNYSFIGDPGLHELPKDLFGDVLGNLLTRSEPTALDRPWRFWTGIVISWQARRLHWAREVVAKLVTQSATK